ncbi:CBS domain-containing protein [Amycolatopsis anabasis]|uniref:CBS domain-containing protein n=1 Tax=Amycolatopsis anabasis TaxID=1840409 RepID=UPI00131CBC28|nr:CBS domain-containing protein [Amycolatopsis anabasis]
MRARDVMSKPVITVTADRTVKHAASLLAHHGFTALPVVDDDERLIGIVTEADLVRDRFPRDETFLGRRPEEPVHERPAATVGEVMSTPATAMGAETDIVEVVRAMLDTPIRSMPIVDGSKVRGIVTRRDLVRALARDDEALARDIRHRLAFFGGPSRWTVSVRDGEAEITDAFDSEVDRRVAAVLAEGVPGVIRAHCRQVDAEQAGETA